MFSNMLKMWLYLCTLVHLGTVYVSGKFGQKDNQGRLMFDCVCLIKSFPWCNGVAGGNPVYKGNGVADDWIGGLYQKATKKGDISTLPKKGIWAVYLNCEHIGIYNAGTGTVIECCGGNTKKVVERPLSFYDGTVYAWNRWSNIYWCDESPEEETKPEAVATTTTQFYRVQTNSFRIKDNAIREANNLKSKGFQAIIKLYDGNYRVQGGAFNYNATGRTNAQKFMETLKAAGFRNAYVTTESGEDVSF